MSINFKGYINLNKGILNQDYYNKFIQDLNKEIEFIKTHHNFIYSLWYINKKCNKLKPRDYTENISGIIVLDYKYVDYLIKILRYIYDNRPEINIGFNCIIYNYDYGKDGYFLIRGCGTILIDNCHGLITHTSHGVKNDANQNHYWNTSVRSYSF